MNDLKDVNQKIRPVILGFGLILIMVGFIVGVTLIGVASTLLGTLLLVFANKLVKTFQKNLVDKVTVTDHIHAAKINSDGDIVETRET